MFTVIWTFITSRLSGMLIPVLAVVGAGLVFGFQQYRINALKADAAEARAQVIVLRRDLTDAQEANYAMESVVKKQNAAIQALKAKSDRMARSARERAMTAITRRPELEKRAESGEIGPKELNAFIREVFP